MIKARKSIDAMPEGDRKASFVAGLETDLPEYFAGRILDIDSLLAATAMVHGLTLVTGNLADFSLPALRILNPWDEPSGQG